MVVPTGTLLTAAVYTPLAATPASRSSGVPLRPKVGSLRRSVVNSSLTVLPFSTAAMRTWRVRSTVVVKVRVAVLCGPTVTTTGAALSPLSGCKVNVRAVERSLSSVAVSVATAPKS